MKLWHDRTGCHRRAAPSSTFRNMIIFNFLCSAISTTMTMMMLMVFPFTQHERGLWWFLNVLQCRASSANNNRLITRLWISFPAANSYNYGRGEVCQKRRQFVEWMEFSLAWNWKTLSRQRCDGCGRKRKSNKGDGEFHSRHFLNVLTSSCLLSFCANRKLLN